MNNNKENQNNILLYKNSEGDIKLDVFLEDETVWLNQSQMKLLFNKARRTIGEHIQNIYEEGELERSSTRRKFRQVQNEGGRNVEREIDYFNLDVIISVGYRVKSKQGTQLKNKHNRRNAPWRVPTGDQIPTGLKILNYHKHDQSQNLRCQMNI